MGGLQPRALHVLVALLATGAWDCALLFNDPLVGSSCWREEGAFEANRELLALARLFFYGVRGSWECFGLWEGKECYLRAELLLLESPRGFAACNFSP